MKVTKEFSKAIRTYLENRGSKDPLFARVITKENKNMEDCMTYILNYVKSSGCNGFTDDEVYNMAIHYFDEDDIDIGKPINCRVVVNHSITLTEEEKAAAHDEAVRLEIEQERQKLRGKKKSTPILPEETKLSNTLF